MSKITKRELHSSLIDYINELIKQNGGSGGGNISSILTQEKNTVMVKNTTPQVEIGISNFDKSRDLLLVFKNSVYLEEGLDYTISEDNSKIVSTEGNWNESGLEISFNFIVFRNETKDPVNIDGSIISDNSITLSKLSGDVIQVLNKNTKDTNSILLNIIRDMKEQINSLKNRLDRLENR